MIGYPRVPWEACGIFDGVSEFRLDSTGKIYEHAVDNGELTSLLMLHSSLAQSWC